MRLPIALAAVCAIVSIAAGQIASHSPSSIVHETDALLLARVVAFTLLLIPVGLVVRWRLPNIFADVGLGLVWGGASANSIEAAFRGGVVDYISDPLQQDYLLSLGDASIMLGLGLAALGGFVSLLSSTRPPSLT